MDHPFHDLAGILDQVHDGKKDLPVGAAELLDHCGRLPRSEIEADSNGAVTTLFPNAKDQRHNLGWNTKADIVWSSRQIPETSYPVLLIAFFPDVNRAPAILQKTGRSG